MSAAFRTPPLDSKATGPCAEASCRASRHAGPNPEQLYCTTKLVAAELAIVFTVAFAVTPYVPAADLLLIG